MQLQVQKSVCQNVHDDQYSHFAHKHFYSWTNDCDAVVSDTGAQFKNSLFEFEQPNAGITQLHALHNSHTCMHVHYANQM